jgi:DNA-binding transcriptional MerR regulator
VTEYRVAELAQAGETSIRNVRVYQDRGLLPPPRRQGRISLYNDSHLARLRLIGRLLGKGYTFATIRELFDSWNGGKDLADTLGLREALTAPWNPEQPIQLTREEVGRKFGSLTPAALVCAAQLGLMIEQGDGYLILSPSLFEAGAELVGAGVPLDVVLDLTVALQHDMSTVARRFIDVLLTHLIETDDAQNLIAPVSAEMAERLLRLRPYAQRTVDALLLTAMQRESDRLLEQEASKARG